MSRADARPNKLLIVTSSGGGGLLQAAIAKEQEALVQNPNLTIIKKDIFKDWVGKAFGKFCVSAYNGVQRNGHMRMQVFFMKAYWVCDLISWPNIFCRALKILFQENVDRIVDTQVMGTSALLKAIRICNRTKKKNIVLEKIVVDLPTKEASHFFGPIKRLSKKDKKFLKLVTVAPLLDEGQSAEEFWQEHCGLSEREIYYEDPVVRQSFRKLQGKPRSEEVLSLPIGFKNFEELQLIQKCLERGSISTQIKDSSIQFAIDPKTLVFTVLLGSQPSNVSTLNYVKEFIRLAQEKNSAEISTHLFVFCADHQVGQQTLFRKTADFVGEIEQYPKHFTVIPFSFQSDDVIAPLFHRSNVTCTRSGGQTAQELMTVSSGEIWVHSEAKRKEKDCTLDELLSGIPGWEGGSALYLKKFYGAKIVTPEIFTKEARRLMRSAGEPAVPMHDPESMVELHPTK